MSRPPSHRPPGASPSSDWLSVLLRNDRLWGWLRLFLTSWCLVLIAGILLAAQDKLPH